MLRDEKTIISERDLRGIENFDQVIFYNGKKGTLLDALNCFPYFGTKEATTLAKLNVKTLADLFLVTDYDLLQQRNCGNKTAQNIREAIESVRNSFIFYEKKANLDQLANKLLELEEKVNLLMGKKRRNVD